MAEAKGPVDFTGYWVLSRVESFDEFLRGLGFGWVVRRAAQKFGVNAVDVIAHTGTAVKITTLNAKGSWTRICDTDRVVEQPNVEGVPCKTRSWWEGSVFHSRIEGSPLGVCESWRYRRGDVMVVKTTVKPPRSAETSVYWFFERMQALQLHLSGNNKRSQLLRQISKDQKRVFEATQRDNAYLQRVLSDSERWSSPADDFIKVASPKGNGNSSNTLNSSQSSLRGVHAMRRGLSSPVTSPPSMSKTPSTTSLSNMAVAPSMPSRSDMGAESRATTVTDSVAGGVGGVSVVGTAISASDPGSPATGNHQHQQQQPLPTTGVALAHRRVTSFENLHASNNLSTSQTPRRAAHYRSPSAESIPGTGMALSASDSRATPVSSPSRGAMPPTGGEALMAYKMHEFLDGRGIMSVIPVATPNDTSEPQLLEMSPEQAEETAAKLRELETDMLLRRQENAKGCVCCGLLITKEKDSLPEHLRVWEMTLA